MVHRIPKFNDRTVQRAHGGMSQTEAWQMRQRFTQFLVEWPIEQQERDMAEFDEIARLGRGNAVDRARRQAVARGVQVVVDETLPHIFVGDDLSDEKPNPTPVATSRRGLHDGTGVAMS
jgi:hypothetical protein